MARCEILRRLLPFGVLRPEATAPALGHHHLEDVVGGDDAEDVVLVVDDGGGEEVEVGDEAGDLLEAGVGAQLSRGRRA